MSKSVLAAGTTGRCRTAASGIGVAATLGYPLWTSPGWIRIGSAQQPRNIPKFRKVQPCERPDLQVAECWMSAARPIMAALASGAATIFLFTE